MGNGCAGNATDALTVRLTQLALLMAVLVLWETAAGAGRQSAVHQLSVGDLADLPRDMLKTTPQQPSILLHAWSTLAATVVGFTIAMIVGTITAAALWWWDGLYKVLDPYLVVANALPKTAFVLIFYIWLGPSLSIYGIALAISLFVTVLMIYSGFQAIDPNKIKLAQTFGASKAQILTKGRAAGQRAHTHRRAGRSQPACHWSASWLANSSRRIWGSASSFNTVARFSR